MSITIVADNEILYRRVPCVEGLYVKQPDRTVKVSTAAFSDRSFRPSVDRAELRQNDPRNSQRELLDGVVSVVTRDVRSTETVVQNDEKRRIIQTFKADVEHLPILNDPMLPDNPAHAEIYMNPVCPNKSVFRKLMERLAQLANERGWDVELQGIV